MSMSMMMNVMCGALTTSDLESICREAEYGNEFRKVCFNYGGIPLGASYEIVEGEPSGSAEGTTRTVDWCRYAETNTDAYNVCTMLGGIPYGESGYSNEYYTY